MATRVRRLSCSTQQTSQTENLANLAAGDYVPTRRLFPRGRAGKDPNSLHPQLPTRYLYDIHNPRRSPVRQAPQQQQQQATVATAAIYTRAAETAVAFPAASTAAAAFPAARTVQMRCGFGNLPALLPYSQLKQSNTPFLNRTQTRLF